MRTTLNIDEPLLAKLKKISLKEKKSLSAVASEIIGVGLKNRRKKKNKNEFVWHTARLEPKIDIHDFQVIEEILLQEDIERLNKPWRHQ